MADPAGDTEQRLRIELMQTHIENKRVDTDSKRELAGWEPWKAITVAAGSAAALFALIGGAIGWLLRGHGIGS